MTGKEAFDAYVTNVIANGRPYQGWTSWDEVRMSARRWWEQYAANRADGDYDAVEYPDLLPLRIR